MGTEFEALCQAAFEGTRILRRPLTGIVSDYHELPYVLVGPRDEGGCTEVSGTIKVSPRLVITPRQIAESFGEILEDDGFMDRELQMRQFRFATARDPSKQIRSQELQVSHLEMEAQARLERREDELARNENVRTALLYCPTPRLYPIALDRFIRSILHREFE